MPITTSYSLTSGAGNIFGVPPITVGGTSYSIDGWVLQPAFINAEVTDGLGIPFDKIIIRSSGADTVSNTATLVAGQTDIAFGASATYDGRSWIAASVAPAYNKAGYKTNAVTWVPNLS